MGPSLNKRVVCSLTADEVEVVTLALVTLLAAEDELGDVFEPGFERVAVELHKRFRQMLIDFGVIEDGD